VFFHPVPNVYISLRFHRFCWILHSAVLSPTSTFVAALLLHSTAIPEASNSLLYPVHMVCMHNNISFPATIFCTATNWHVCEHLAAPPDHFLHSDLSALLWTYHTLYINHWFEQISPKLIVQRHILSDGPFLHHLWHCLCLPHCCITLPCSSDTFPRMWIFYLTCWNWS
jgi:hypothetical protein